MFYYVFFVIIALTLIVLMLLLKINIVIEYNKGRQNDGFVLSFFAFKRPIGFTYKMNELNTKKDGLFTQSKKIIQNIEKSKEFYERNKQIIKKVLKYLKCRICVERLDLKAVIGTGNASHTAILIGIAWSGVGVLVSMLHNFTDVKDKKIEIKPDFVGKKFNLELYCIFKVKVVYIIVIGLMVLKHIIKAKVGFINLKRSVAMYK